MSSDVRSSLIAAAALLLLGVAPALADGPYRFFGVSPCRLVDTRNAGEGPALGANTTRDFQVQGKCGVPVGAKAASLKRHGRRPGLPGAPPRVPVGDGDAHHLDDQLPGQ